MSTTEENKAAFRRTFEELFNKGNYAAAVELLAPDYLNHEAPPGKNRGPESMPSLIMWLRAAFPDMHYTVEDVVAEGDTVAGRVIWTGTHQGSYMGIPPTGRSFQVTQMHFVRFRDGKGIEHRAVRDDLGLMRQLGVIPAPVNAG